MKIREEMVAETIMDTLLEHEVFDAEISTFEEKGVLTRDSGFVVRLSDGTEYQVTVVRSK